MIALSLSASGPILTVASLLELPLLRTRGRVGSECQIHSTRLMNVLASRGPGCKDQRNPECKVFRDNDDAGPAKTS